MWWLMLTAYTLIAIIYLLIVWEKWYILLRSWTMYWRITPWECLIDHWYELFFLLFKINEALLYSCSCQLPYKSTTNSLHWTTMCSPKYINSQMVHVLIYSLLRLACIYYHLECFTLIAKKTHFYLFCHYSMFVR